MKNTETFHSTYTSETGRYYDVYTELVGEDYGEEFYAMNPTWRRPQLHYNIYWGDKFVNWVHHPVSVPEVVWYFENPGYSTEIGSRFD